MMPVPVLVTRIPPHPPSVPTANSSASSIGGSEAHPCHNCKMFKQLLSDVLIDTLTLREKTLALSTSASTMLDLGIHKASTFQLLHEAAILKETASIAPPARASKARRIEAVNKNAKSQFQQLKNLPPTSHKWTWGETLTEDDVLALRQIGT